MAIFSLRTPPSFQKGDTISSRLWRFGDGATSTQESPTHTYGSPGAYNCILQIATTQGCNSADTMLIELCSIGLDFNLGTLCNDDGNVALTVTVTDVFNSLQFINVFLDDILVNDTAYRNTARDAKPKFSGSR